VAAAAAEARLLRLRFIQSCVGIRNVNNKFILLLEFETLIVVARSSCAKVAAALTRARLCFRAILRISHQE